MDSGNLVTHNLVTQNPQNKNSLRSSSEVVVGVLVAVTVTDWEVQSMAWSETETVNHEPTHLPEHLIKNNIL